MKPNLISTIFSLVTLLWNSLIHGKTLTIIGLFTALCGVTVSAFSEPDLSVISRDPNGAIVVTNAPDTDTTAAQPAYAPGRIIVKYRDSVTLSVTDIVRQGRIFQQSTTDYSDSLDKLHARYKVKDAKPVFRTEEEENAIPGSKTLKALRALQQRKIADTKRNFPIRAASAPDITLPALEHVYVLSIDTTDVLEAVKDFAADPHVEYAQPDYTATINWTPNDPYYTSTTSPNLWGLTKISTSTAWDTSRGAGITVAVVDTGIDFTHPDIIGNTVAGWDFVSNDADPTDGNGHGTHVAGTIAAVGNNGIGVIGVAPSAKIMPMRALDNYGRGTMSNVSVAMAVAAVQGARVINNSWGCSKPCESNPVAEEAVHYAYGLGAVVVFSAGNNGYWPYPYPDAYFYSPGNMPESITVAATTSADAKEPNSNRGGSIDIAAPGDSILSLKSSACTICNTSNTVGTQYLQISGTSMAAPHVSGAAALILALHPTFTNEQVRQALRRGSDALPAAVSPLLGSAGRLNASNALTVPSPLTVKITAPYPATLAGMESVNIYGVATGSNFASWTLSYSSYNKGFQPTTWATLATSTTPVPASSLLKNGWTLPAGSEGLGVLRLQATKTNGEVYEDRQEINVDQFSFTTSINGYYPLAFGSSLITLNGTVTGSAFQSYQFKIRTKEGVYLTNPSIWLSNNGMSKVVNNFLGFWNTFGIPAGGYYIELVITYTDGTTSSESMPVTVDPTLSLGWPKAFDLAYTSYPTYYAPNHPLNAADVNGDGKTDIILGYGRSVQIIDNNGIALAGWPQSTNNFVISGATLGDLDGDSIKEVIASTITGTVYVWKRNGTLLSGWPKYVAGRELLLAVDDINGDGRTEIIATTRRGGPMTVLDATGTPLPGWPVNFSMTTNYSDPAIADLDGDGMKEIVMAVSSAPGATVNPTVYVLRYDGTPQTFVLSTTPVSTYNGANNVLQVVLTDLDGDTYPDIIVNYGKTLYALNRNGVALTGWPKTVATTLMPPSLGDMNGDGKPEVIIGQEQDNFTRMKKYLNAWQGDGTSLTNWPISLPETVNEWPNVVYNRNLNSHFSGGILADLDGDLNADVITDGPGSYSVVHAYNQNAPSGGSASPSDISGFPKLTAEGIACLSGCSMLGDFDGDGKLELAWFGWTYSSSLFYYADSKFALFLWDLTASASNNQPWPMYGQNPGRTNYLE